MPGCRRKYIIQKGVLVSAQAVDERSTTAGERIAKTINGLIGGSFINGDSGWIGARICWRNLRWFVVQAA